MPSGRTHDRLTLWFLPVVAAGSWLISRQSDVSLVLSGSYLFAGLMFGPDLDVRSRQSQRWGPLRWIWLPYRRCLRHRSWFSHGPILGTVGRVLYLGLWLLLFLLLIEGAIALVQGGNWNGLSDRLGQHQQWFWTGLSTRPDLGLGALLGLELGAMSHSLSDWVGSTWKRWRRSPRKTARQRPVASRSSRT
ncbi:metal-binding protein [Synechococcus elongatus]|uniref:Metal-binding protein n=1 Tax=Synechococcus elongatus PCC 11802 TaxID=2283154 RepID=A0AAT9JT15_SYNEL|nr:metal-binding protein [Synechococcus elongatus]QFZ92359.1 metal-binding protein [Synechococcus elongatus PCC 11802]